MPNLSRRSVSEQLNAAQLAITNTLSNPEIQTLVAAYGYTAEQMQAGQQLYADAVKASAAQVAAMGAQRQAAAAAHEAEQAARANHQALAQVIRAVFGNGSPQCVTLGLVGRTPVATAAFISAATNLLTNIGSAADIARPLAHRGYDAAQLERDRAALAAFVQADHAHIAAMGAAQQATQDRRVVLAALNEWLAQYLRIARVALRERPQLLEQIGVLVRSGRPTAQRRPAARRAAAPASEG